MATFDGLSARPHDTGEPMTPLLIAALLAQSPAPAAEGETRTISYSVVDDKDEAVRTLTAEDVAVQEDGVARPLQRLELDPRPLAVAVLLDTSVAMAPHYRLYLVDAVLQFLLRLPEGTRYAIWTTGDRPTKIFDWSDNRAAAAKALRRVVPQGGNTLLDALVEASRDLKNREDARSAIVVVTGMGVGFAGYDRRQVVDELQKQPVTVLGVEVDEDRSLPTLGASDQTSGLDYDFVLATAAKSSGGARETVLSPMGIEKALKGLAAQLTSRYRLTFAGAAGPRTPKVDLTVALPGVKVRMGAPRR
jgi:VWFA-related protein